MQWTLFQEQQIAQLLKDSTMQDELWEFFMLQFEDDNLVQQAFDKIVHTQIH